MEHKLFLCKVQFYRNVKPNIYLAKIHIGFNKEHHHLEQIKQRERTVKGKYTYSKNMRLAIFLTSNFGPLQFSTNPFVQKLFYTIFKYKHA